jgi:hypothetical protein
VSLIANIPPSLEERGSPTKMMIVPLTVGPVIFEPNRGGAGRDPDAMASATPNSRIKAQQITIGVLRLMTVLLI